MILFTWFRSQFARDDVSSIETAEYQLFSFRTCAINYNYTLDEPSVVTAKIVYSPTSPWLEQFLQSALNSDGQLEFESFNNAQDLDGFIQSNKFQSQSFFGIEFEDSLLVKKTTTNCAIILTSQTFIELRKSTGDLEVFPANGFRLGSK